MSSDAGAEAAAIVSRYENLYTDGYCQLAVLVLLVFEAFLTFDREVACFWTAKRRVTGASLLYFANKWIALSENILALIGFASFPSDNSCTVFQRATFVVQILPFVPGAIFSALRAFVLSRSHTLGLVVLVLSFAPVGANLARYGYNLAGERIPPFGCLDTDDTTEAIDLRFILISRVPLIIADITLICITWTKLNSREALRDIRQSKRLSLSGILFRDGTIYFIVLFILNVLHLTFSLDALEVDDDGASYVTNFDGPLTAVLISRFLLELQEANRADVRVDHSSPLQSSGSRDLYGYDSTPSFISSIGAFINPDLAVSRDDGESEWHVQDSRSDTEEKCETQDSEP